MKRLYIAIALFFMFGATSAFAQGFQVIMYYIPDFGAPLTTTCGGATGIPDGRVVKLFWDSDSDGPDETDPQAPLCNGAPNCETGPIGSVNINQWTMNGVAQGFGAGYWVLDNSIYSSLGMPVPARYYLRVYEADGTTVIWTSSWREFVADIQTVEWTFADWTCGAAGPQCTVIDEHE